MTDNIYRRFLQLPLFQGLSHQDFLAIAGKVRFDFRTMEENRVILKQGDSCNSYFFIIRGEYESIHVNNSPTYTLTEYFDRPAILDVESLYGLHPYYFNTYRCKSTVTLLEIHKDVVFNVLMNYATFRINYMNMFNYLASKRRDLLWQGMPATIEERFAHFLRTRLSVLRGPKSLHIRQSVLAHELATNFRNVSKMLSEYEAKGFLSYGRMHIDIPAVEKLL